MSLGVVIKGPEGVVLAADSRVTLQGQRPDGPVISVNFDNATKLLSFEKQKYVGAVTYGMAVIGLRTAHSLLPEFEVKLSEDRLSVEEFSKQLSQFFIEQWRAQMPKDFKGPDMTFVVGGYDKEDPYGKVFLFSIPNKPDLERRNAGENDFGMTWGGQLELICRMIHGYDPTIPQIIEKTVTDSAQAKQLIDQFKHLAFPIPYQIMPLQDSVDLAISMIRSTITFQNLAAGLRGVGGPIDVAVISRTKSLHYIQRKEITGEKSKRGENEY